MRNDGGEADADQGRLVGGRYRLMERIGSGGSGTVWRAFDELERREVAVKQPRLPGDPEGEEHRRAAHRLHREARAAARVDHPAAVTILDVVVEAEQPDQRPRPQGPDELDATELLDGLPWIVMELVPGESLRDTLRRGPVDPPEAARIGLALLGALRTAHSVGIVHRDVKPSNVLIAEGGRVVLTDFGTSPAQGDESPSSGEEFTEPPAWVAPERMSGRIAGPASDLWSLGVLLYTAVEGASPSRRAISQGTSSALLTAERAERAERAGRAAPAEPAGSAEPRRAGPLGPLIGRLLVPDPEQRPDAEEVAKELEAVAGPAAGTHEPPARERAVRQETEAAAAARRQLTPAARQEPVPAVRREPVSAAGQEPVPAKPQTPVPPAEPEAIPPLAQTTTPSVRGRQATTVPPGATLTEREAAPHPGDREPASAPALARRRTLLRPGPLALLGALLAGGAGAATHLAGTSSAETTETAGTTGSAEHAADATDTTGSADTPATTDAWTPHPEPDLAAVLYLPRRFHLLERTGDGTGGPRTALYGDDDRGGSVQVRLRFWERAPGSPMAQARKTPEAGGETHYSRTGVQGHAAALADTAYHRGEQPRRALRVLIRADGDRMYELRVDMPAGTPEERAGVALFEGARDRLGIVKG
ncbi:serine/threonine-protein kinase [Streptomyces sp. DT190]|uniref:serine/threonine-protein kinase n=1 Tax=unclassified Streptomyces TaxID=2593676 RepID=UPI003CF62C29